MAQPIKPIRPGEKKTVTQTPPSSFAFGKQNYQLMIIGLVIITIGFFLMSGTDDIFSTTKMVVSPIVVVFGFAFEIYAILKKTPANPQ